MHNKIDIDLEIAHLPVDLVTGIKISDKETAKFGEQVTFTADVFEDKRFVGWSVKGVDETELDLTKSPLTITMPANDINVAAQLEQLYKITVSGGCTADKEWAAEGEQVTVTKPTPPEGHAFYWWSTGITQDWSNRENTVTFTMPAGDVQISASKVLLNYLFTMVGGTATGVKSGEPNTVTDGRSNGFDYGTDVTITANEPETGKRFTGWTITGVDTSELVLTDRELTFTMPSGNVTATAELRDLDKRSVTVQGGAAQVGDGTLATSLEAYCGDTVTLTAYQSAEKTFVKWTIEGIDDTTGLDLTQRVLTFTMPDNDVSATAEFENVPTNLTFEGDVATSGELWYVNNDSKSFRLPLGSGQDSCTYTIELSNPAFTFKVYGSDGEVYIDDNGEGVKSITIDREDNYTIEVINTGTAANCTLTVTKV